jgi:signal transduction histidine kinase
MVVFLAVIVLYVQDQINQQTENIESTRLLLINQIASRTELRVDNAISVLKVLSKNTHVTNPPSATLIDDKLHGIPEDVDIDRRNAMRYVFDEYGGFQNMLFLLPNGDVYINEPFFFQKNMTVSNFAFRDWYKEVIDNKDVIISDLVISKSSNNPNIVIAVPVFSQDKSLQGILTGSLSLDIIEEKLEELKSYTDERIIIVDDTRTVIADSEDTLKGQSLTLGIGAIKNSFVGKSGTVTDTINDTKVFVTYYPIKAGQNTWSIISIQPYDQVFSSVNKTFQGSLILVTIIIIVELASIITVNRYFQTQFKLRKQSEETSTSLTKTQGLLLKSNNTIQEQLDQLQKMDTQKSEFSSMITHELKTPLVPITVYCKMLKSNMLGNINKEQIDAINVIEKNAKSLDHLINDVLDARKLDVKKLKFNTENVNIGEFFDEIYSSHHPIINQKGHKLVIDISDKHITIKTDKNRLRQVFDNLISNALKFMPEENGLIEITMERKDMNLVFHIKDNGLGIPLDKQDKIFQKFYQVDTSARRKITGTGLGLAISKGITEGLGGKIWFESDGKTGTTFFIQLSS